ncbi:phage tail spike protein [Tepidibacillus marianensis]|uniref:phage tail spike protein n=1 Tax=Tepidibacillus marianensis TaxID=3131995 RepID=UPI0030D17836
MILIFNKNEQLETVLDNNGDSCPYYDAIHTEQINGENTFQFSIPADHPDAQYVVEGGLIAFKDVDQNYQLFEINRVEDDHSDSLIRTVYCEHAVYELLDEFIVDKRPTNTTAYNALTDALAGTRWQVGNIDELGLNSTNFYRENPISALQKILNTWNGEVGYRVEIVGNQITGRYIDIFQRRGADTGKRFEYGKDIESVERTVDASNVKTALYGFGKGEETGDGYGRRLTFADVEWKVANGDPVDKPLGQEWVGDPNALSQWGRVNGTRHRFGTYENPDTDDPIKLLEDTWSKLQEMKVPLVSYKMTVTDLELLSGYEHEAVRLGDTVAEIDRELNQPIITKERVMEVKRYILKPKKTGIVLGNFLPMITDDSARLSSLESRVHTNSGIWNDKYKPGDPLLTSWLEGIIDTLQNEVRSTNGYVYMKDGDGIITLDKPIDQNPTKATRIKGGIISIADQIDPVTGDWDWRTFLTGSGAVADFINTGKLNASVVSVGPTSFFESGYDPSTKETPDGAQTKANTAETNAKNASVLKSTAYNGVTIDAVNGFKAIRSDGLVQTIINATTGIKIQRNISGTWTDQFYVDTNGKAIFSGDIKTSNLFIDGQGGLNDALGMGAITVKVPNEVGTSTMYVIGANRLGQSDDFELYFARTSSVGGVESNLTMVKFNAGAVFSTGNLEAFGNIIADGDYYLNANHQITSKYNNGPTLKDHGNGNVTLSAAGGSLYLGYYSTGTIFNQVKTLMPNGSGIKGNNTGAANMSYFSFYESNGTTRQGWVGAGSTANSDIYLSADVGSVRLNAYNSVVYFGSTSIDYNGGNARWRRDASNYIYQDGTQVGFYIGGVAKHTFRSDGTKSGGSIVIDGKNYGMSPIDSPRTMISDLMQGINVSTAGTKVYLDSIFYKTINGYSLFFNKNGIEIVEQAPDYFVIKSTDVDKVVDIFVIGTRVGEEGKYFYDLDVIDTGGALS